MSKFLDDLDDMEVDRILRLSHAEIVAEIKAHGEDPDKIVREINETIQRAKRDAYREQKFRCDNGQSS